MGRKDRDAGTDDPAALAKGLQDTCAAVNRMCYDLSRQGVMEYRDHWPKRTTPENIEWVRTDKTRRRKFQRILEGLGDFEEPFEKAAFLLRAFSGLQLFPDANHRTGLIITLFVLDQHKWRFSATPHEMVEVVEHVRSERGPLSARRTVKTIRDRDASFDLLCAFMKAHCRPLTLLERLTRRWRARTHLTDAFGRLPMEPFHMAEAVEQERHRKRRTKSSK